MDEREKVKYYNIQPNFNIRNLFLQLTAWAGEGGNVGHQ